MKSYSGSCGPGEGICTDYDDIDIVMQNIQGNREDASCQMIGSDCKISFTIRNFDLKENAKLKLEITEAQSLCSGIFLKVETSSSIPGEVSSISNFIMSDGDQFFRGSIPTTFSYHMTPSLFKTDSHRWQDDQKGYHILPQEDPSKGSQVNISE